MPIPAVSRRSFIKTSAAAAAGLALSARSWSQVAGANGDVRVAVIGLHGRGKDHLRTLSRVTGARVVALCDADSAVLSQAAAALGGGVQTYGDVRELLAFKDVDAVTIAMPNHWHALAGIWAMQAGKDVYVEKPVSHTMWEGVQLAAAAAKYGRVVQSGMQIRSGEGLQEAVAWIRAGNLGKITASRGFCYKYRGSIGKVAATPPPPATVNLDLWCGPTPLAAPHRAQFHYDWHWFWATGNGDVGNQGPHQMDVARWMLGEEGLPLHTMSIGGRLGYEDDGQTPNTFVVVHDYASAPIIFEVRGLPAQASSGVLPAAGLAGASLAEARAGLMDTYRGVRVGNVVDCEGGSLVTDTYFEARAYDADGKLLREFKGADRMMQNFIDVVRSRRTSDLYGPVDEGRKSAALCHLANISHRVGSAAAPGEMRERINGSAPLAEAYGRMVEHLSRNNVDLAATPLTLGAPLAIDPAAGRFTGGNADLANPLLSGGYRSPFVVPEIA
jgi:predicted dehydrogenase